MYRIKQDARSLLSGNLLYRALAKQMQIKPFQLITIKELVEIAQVGRSTFYRNFDKPEDILHWKCDERFQQFYETFVQFSLPNRGSK